MALEAGIISLILSTFVGFATIFYSRKTNRETNLTKLVEMGTLLQNQHIDQLQEDLDRYRKMALDNEEIIYKLRQELRDERHSRRTAEAAVRLAEHHLSKLEEEKSALETHCKSLEETIKTLRSRKRNNG